MNAPKGLDRRGLSTGFEIDETLKSNLILEGELLASQRLLDEAADRFAQAAEIEETLSRKCADSALREKSWMHLLSAASCWARAGNFHEAIQLGDELLAYPDLPPRLRQRVHDFTEQLRKRRIQWSAGLKLTGIEAS